MIIQILTSKDSWLYKKRKKNILKFLKKFSRNVSIINDHKNIKKNTFICFIVSYYKIIPLKFLKFCKFNLVVHESDLPKGKGFSPLFHQILEGKKQITFTLFEASKKMDSGNFYFKKNFYFNKNLLYEEIKDLQFRSALKMLEKFIKKYNKYKKVQTFKQSDKSTFYLKRSSKDSELNINKSIIKQFNLLRICDNENFPAFFIYKKNKYLLKITKCKK